MRPVDYDTEQHADYARGRAVSAPQLRVWLDTFATVLSTERPLHGLDVGSGTGRFTPALADAFGPVVGVEPSVRMREIAERDARHPDVRYEAGSAEAIPAPAEAADYALLFCSWHHVADRDAAVVELRRVLRPGGRVLLRSNFRDHHPRPWWLGYFDHGLEADAAMFQPLHQVVAEFTAGGFRVVHFGLVTEPSSCTRAEMRERLHLRTLSFFAQLEPAAVDEGFRRLDAAVAADPHAPAPTFAEPVLALERV